MNWVARAKETFLGVSVPHAQPAGLDVSAPIRWDGLQALRSAVNERLTGSPETHPATQAFSQAGDVRHYLVLADTMAEAGEIAAAVAPLANDARATVRSLERDRVAMEQSRVTTSIGGEQYDLILASLPDDVLGDPEGVLAGLSAALTGSGFLWLNLRPDLASWSSASAHRTGLFDEFLQLIPSRWRMKQRFVGAPGGAHAASGATAVEALQARFEVISQQSRGGALLGPLIASGCIAPEMDEGAEGRALLQALYRTEADLIDSGELIGTDRVYLARPRHHRTGRLRDIFEKHAGPLPEGAGEGMSGPLPQWIKFNMTAALTGARAADYAAPFPPTDLMYHTTGLDRDRDFAQHGADILKVLSAASPRPLNGLDAVLDFGVGVGRVARYFKGFSGRYVGVDIDQSNLDWVAGSLPWVEAVRTEPAAPFPFEDATFDGVVSISVFTHIDRDTTNFYVDDLHRVTRPGALLFLTLHGERALARALSEDAVERLIGIPRQRLEAARENLAGNGFDFAEQYTHLTRPNYRYGTTFVSQTGAEAIFGRRFRVHGFVPGAIHDFQDLIVLERA